MQRSVPPATAKDTLPLAGPSGSGRLGEALAPLRNAGLILSYLAHERGGRVELIWAAASASSLLGYECDALLEPAWLESTLHPDDRHAARELHERVLATGRHAVAEYRFRHADGSWRWLRGECQRVAGDPTPILLALWSDVTPEHAARAALDVARRELERCQYLRELAHLGAELTREIEHALTAIRGHCAELQSEPASDAERQRDRLDAIARAAATAAALTGRLHALHDPVGDAARSREQPRRA